MEISRHELYSFPHIEMLTDTISNLQSGETQVGVKPGFLLGGGTPTDFTARVSTQIV
jgi:hypothetical protein